MTAHGEASFFIHVHEQYSRYLYCYSVLWSIIKYRY